MYRFKIYYNDGTTEIRNCTASKPEYLYNDFDGLMDWDEFYSLCEKNLNTQDILKIASKVYQGFLKAFYKIEIINNQTLKIIDSIEIN